MRVVRLGLFLLRRLERVERLERLQRRFMCIAYGGCPGTGWHKSRIAFGAGDIYDVMTLFALEGAAFYGCNAAGLELDNLI